MSGDLATGLVRPASEGLTDDGAFFASWLDRQCGALTGARAGVILRVTMNGPMEAAAWPPMRPPPSDLTRIAERAATATKPVIAWIRRPDGKPGLDLLIGLGIRIQSELAGVIAVKIDVPGGIETIDPDAIAAQLHMGAGWLDARLARGQARMAAIRIDRASVAMDLVAVASARGQFTQAATAVVNELAIRLSCARVSLGFAKNGVIHLKAMSHAAAFEKRGRVVDAIENAMEECLAQAASVVFPPLPSTSARIAVAHRDLAALEPVPMTVASVLLPGPKGPAGVLLLERPVEAAFDDATLGLIEAAGALIGPVLHIQANGDRMVAGRIADTTSNGIAALVGPGRPALKLGAIMALVVLAVLCVVRAQYRVTTRAMLEGEIQRAAVAPFDGFVATSPVRPGDKLKAGDVLASMDDRDLVLERARAWADAEKARQKYTEAMAKHDRPNAAVQTAEIDQAEARLALAEDKLRRSRIVSPIDGLLINGDLSQMLGMPVERGKTLFEIAPLDQYRIVLKTDDRDLRFVAVGQEGELALSGMPDGRRHFTVTRITPIAEAKDGRNEFRVEARLDEDGVARDALRPGMEGVAKIETGSHPLIWVWTHGLIDWVRLTLWKWSP